MEETLHRLWSDDEGQDLVEYSLVGLLLGLVVVTVMGNIGLDISSVLSRAASRLK